MPKYVYETVRTAVSYECAYCDYDCDYEGIGYRRAGEVDIWNCPEHGKYYVVLSPLVNRGYQVR